MTGSRRPQPKAGAHRPGDWVWAQAEYEAGNMSVRQIAQEIGFTDTAVSVRASRLNWQRDPAARQRVVAERERLARLALEEKRSEVIAVTAAMQSTVLVSHRADIKAARGLAATLMQELAAVTAGLPAFDGLGEALRAEDDRGRDKLNDIYKRVISLPERSTTLNSLVNALKTLVLLERQAFGIAGLIEDPEAVRPPAEVTRGLDQIMQKFDAVLALQAPVQGTSPEIIVDVSAKNSTAVAERAV